VAALGCALRPLFQAAPKAAPFPAKRQSLGHAQMLLISPPSMRTDAPVNHFAAGDTRKPKRSAISSGVPKRAMPTSSGNFLNASSTVRL